MNRTSEIQMGECCDTDGEYCDSDGETVYCKNCGTSANIGKE